MKKGLVVLLCLTMGISLFTVGCGKEKEVIVPEEIVEESSDVLEEESEDEKDVDENGIDGKSEAEGDSETDSTVDMDELQKNLEAAKAEGDAYIQELDTKIEETLSGCNLSIDNKESFDETIAKEMQLDALNGIAVAKMDAGFDKDVHWTLHLHESSVKNDFPSYDEQNTVFKMTVAENESIQIKISYTINDGYGFSINVYNPEKDYVAWVNITDNTAMVSAEGNVGDFKDFYSDIDIGGDEADAVADYDNVPIDNSIHNYVGCFISSIEGSTNMIIKDKDGNNVALVTCEDNYNDFHDIPIVDWEELSKCASCADGLNFQVGYDENGKVICIG